MPQYLFAHECLGFRIAGTRGHWRLSRGVEERAVNFPLQFRANHGEGLRQPALAGVGILLRLIKLNYRLRFALRPFGTFPKVPPKLARPSIHRDPDA